MAGAVGGGRDPPNAVARVVTSAVAAAPAACRKTQDATREQQRGDWGGETLDHGSECAATAAQCSEKGVEKRLEMRRQPWLASTTQSDCLPDREDDEVRIVRVLPRHASGAEADQALDLVGLLGAS